MKKFDIFLQSFYDSLNKNIDFIPNNISLIHIIDENAISYEIMKDNLIYESRLIYRKSDLLNLINVVLNMDNENVLSFSKDDISKIQSIKKFGSWIKPNKKLGIIKSKFLSFNDFYLLVKKLVDSVDIKKLIEPFSMMKIGKSMYMPFSNEVGILYFNSDKINEDIVCHEFIHFFQDVTGNGFIKAKQTDKFNPIEELAKRDELETFGMINRKKSIALISNHEVIPYFNNICYILKRNKVSAKVALNAINGLISFMNELRKRNGTIKELKDKIKDNLCFSGISINEFAILVICLMYGQHLTLLKSIVGNYLKDK